MEFKKPKIVKTLEKEEQNGKTYLRSITKLQSFKQYEIGTRTNRLRQKKAPHHHQTQTCNLARTLFTKIYSTTVDIL